MDPKLIGLLEQSPFLFLIVVMVIAIMILWKTLTKKDLKIYELAENVIKVASIYEKNINMVETQNKEHNIQHARIIEILLDVKRIIEK